MFSIRALPRSLPRTSTRIIRNFTPIQSRYLQTPAQMSSNEKMNQHVCDTITQDHREIETYYKNILNAKDNDEATRWQNQFTWELARHSIAEELVVYPQFEKTMGEAGKKMAEDDRAQHQQVYPSSLFIQSQAHTLTHSQVKEDLKAFQNMKAGTDEFIPQLKKLMDHLSQHIKEEEEHDLPLLRKNIDEAQGLELAKSFGRTKMFVPSRSHPSAPNKPPFETIAGLFAAPIDHLGDMLRKFPDETVSPNPSTK